MTEPPDRDELPPPSAELMLFGAFARAVLRRASKRDRIAIIEDVTRTLDAHAEGHTIHRIRARSEDAKVRREGMRARAWWLAALGILLSGLD